MIFDLLNISFLSKVVENILESRRFLLIFIYNTSCNWYDIK